MRSKIPDSHYWNYFALLNLPRTLYNYHLFGIIMHGLVLGEKAHMSFFIIIFSEESGWFMMKKTPKTYQR